MPNVSDVVKSKQSKLKNEIASIIESGDLKAYVELAQDILDGHKAEQTIAALIKYFLKNELDARTYSEIGDTSVDHQGKARLFVALGKNDGMTISKLVYFIKRREGIERSTLDRFWLETHVPNVVAALRRTPTARRYTVDLVDPTRERVYDGIAQISLEGPHPSFADVKDYKPDGFEELVQPMLIARGHEIRIID